MLLVTTRMGMLVPSNNGMYFLPMTHDNAGLSSPLVDSLSGKFVVQVAECDPALWHSRMGHLNMHSL
jgi:hypothetical protein